MTLLEERHARFLTAIVLGVLPSATAADPPTSGTSGLRSGSS
jgi:hypothetical protein